MTRNFTMKETDTIVGYFKKLKKGDVFHISGERVNKDGFRFEAVRQNKEARLLGLISRREVRYSVSTIQKKGCVTIMYN